MLFKDPPCQFERLIHTGTLNLINYHKEAGLDPVTFYKNTVTCAAVRQGGVVLHAEAKARLCCLCC